MNKKTTYELIITEKLQHLPLPDMEDAIWARVKAQLDADLPDDDNDGGDVPDNPSGWWGGVGWGLFVAALVGTFFLFNKSSKQPSTELPHTFTQPTTSSSSTPIIPAADTAMARRDNTLRSLPPPITGSPPTILTNSRADSLAAAPVTVLPQTDSMPATTVMLPPPVKSDTTRPQPKTRGVRGITDDDYRIVPAKRDSS